METDTVKVGFFAWLLGLSADAHARQKIDACLERISETARLIRLGAEKEHENAPSQQMVDNNQEE